MMAWSLTVPPLGARSLGFKCAEQEPTSSCFASLNPALARFVRSLTASLGQILGDPWGMAIRI